MGLESVLVAKYCPFTQITESWFEINSNLATQCHYLQSPEVKFRSAFFGFKSFVFLAVWQKTYELRSSLKYTKFLQVWSTENWETQLLKGEKCQPQLHFRTLIMRGRGGGSESSHWVLRVYSVRSVPRFCLSFLDSSTQTTQSSKLLASRGQE